MGIAVGVGAGVAVGVGVSVGVGVGEAVGVGVSVGVAVGVGVGVGVACSSKAPISTVSLTMRGKPGPRWSLAKGLPFVSTASVLLPWSMAGLPGSSAIVCVGPPLFCRPLGSSSAAVLRMSPLALRRPPGSVVSSPPAASSLKLEPRDVIVPPLLEMFPAVVPLASTVLAMLSIASTPASTSL